MNKYLIQNTIETSLQSHANDVDINHNGSNVKLRLKIYKDNPYANAQVCVTATSYEEALGKSEDILSAVLDVGSFVMKSSLFSISIDYVLKSEQGKSERIIYRHILFERSNGLFITDDSKDAIQSLLNNGIAGKYELPLRWLRYAYRAGTIIEQFIYLWMALERIVGEQQIIRRCKCGEEFSYPSVPKDGIRAILKKHNKEISDDEIEMIWKARQKVFHGGKKPAQEMLGELRSNSLIIMPIIEAELISVLNPSKKISITMPVPPKSKYIYLLPIKYITKHIDAEFAFDYPDLELCKKLIEPGPVPEIEGISIIPGEEFQKLNW